MNTNRILICVSILALSFVVTIRACGQPFDLFWHTVDGGGTVNSTGGAFALSGTIGQADAQTPPVMAGGAFQLVGGFWPGESSSACSCPGDMNDDGSRNGRDIQQFTSCVVSGGACGCADVDGLPGVNAGDVTVFVADLIAGTTCP